jgi:hypothetical protein
MLTLATTKSASVVHFASNKVNTHCTGSTIKWLQP